MQVAVNTYHYLKFVDFVQLETWSYAFLVEGENKYNKSFKTIRIGDFLQKDLQTVIIEDEKSYNRVTVKINTNGVIKRDTEIGKNIGTKKQFKAQTGQFIVSKIDARNGAFGIIPSELNGAIVTNDFPLFNIDTSVINPQFFFLLTGTKEFINFAKSCSSGTTNRQRMDIGMFLNQKIPLPTLAEQEAIVKNYFSKMEEAENLNKQASDLEGEIERYFLEQLGVKKTESKVSIKGLQIVQFSDIDRWDVWVNKSNNNKSCLKLILFKEMVIGKPVYGANVKGVKKVSDVRYIRITDINENGTLNEEFVSPEFVEEKYILKENDFLIARSGNTVGKTFLYKEKYGKAIYAGYLVKYNIDYSKVIPEYLFEYTKSYTFKNWIASNQRVAGQPNINGQEYLQAPFIIPAISKQQEIVNHIKELKENIKEQKDQAEQLKTQASQEFEKAIFSTMSEL